VKFLHRQQIVSLVTQIVSLFQHQLLLHIQSLADLIKHPANKGENNFLSLVNKLYLASALLSIK